MDEAEVLFREAEDMQKDFQPEYHLLYSLAGFRYCDLLLAQGKHDEVLRRAEKLFEWRIPAGPLLDIAFDHLSLGRAHMLQAQKEDSDDFSQATEHLDQAVEGLRDAGQQDELPRGLLARAELRRAQEDFEPAQRDLDEAFDIAERGGMGLHLADCHLGYARLHLAMGDKPKARENLDTAKEMIEQMGYHRRDSDVERLEGELG
ncbi:MAG: hypothetical protein IH861_04805 [Chloroflexi bacterium]|nr:hypothetical protein [Chloroflexota bacterium]